MDQSSFLTLNDFTFEKTRVNPEEIKKFDAEDQFMPISVELFKEVGKITALLSCTYRLDEKNMPRKWNRDEAIIGGLVVRISKLQIGLLQQICEKRTELAFIIFRCLGESLINLVYLLQKGNEQLFNEYIEYSLRFEKRLFNMIEKNIARRGSELPMESRMKASIDHAFKKLSFTPEQVQDKKKESWGEAIFRRAEKVGWEEGFFAIWNMPSHNVHGNWQDLLTHHLVEEDGKFSPKTEWTKPRPHLLFAAGLLSAKAMSIFLNRIIPECSDKSEITSLLNDINLRIIVADELHEQFLQKKKSIPLPKLPGSNEI